MMGEGEPRNCESELFEEEFLFGNMPLTIPDLGQELVKNLSLEVWNNLSVKAGGIHAMLLACGVGITREIGRGR
jgi:hypothetical protein